MTNKSRKVTVRFYPEDEYDGVPAQGAEVEPDMDITGLIGYTVEAVEVALDSLIFTFVRIETWEERRKRVVETPLP